MAGPPPATAAANSSTDYSHRPVKLCLKSNPFVDHFRENLSILEPDLIVGGLKVDTDVHSLLLRMISPAFDRAINYGRGLGYEKLVKLSLNYCKIDGLLCLRDLLYKGIHSTTYGEIKSLNKQLCELKLPVFEEIKRPVNESAVQEYIGQVHITVQIKKEVIQELEKHCKPEFPSDDEDLVKPKQDDNTDPSKASSPDEDKRDSSEIKVIKEEPERRENIQSEEKVIQKNGNNSNQDTPDIKTQATKDLTSQLLNSSSEEKVMKEHGTTQVTELTRDATNLASSKPLEHLSSLRRDSSSERIGNSAKLAKSVNLENNVVKSNDDGKARSESSTSEAPYIPCFSCEPDSLPTVSDTIVNCPDSSGIIESNGPDSSTETKETSRDMRIRNSEKDIDSLAKKIWVLLPNASHFMVEQEVYQCFICKLKLKQKSGWKRHLMVQHFYYKIWCPGCGERFKRKETLAKHKLFCRVSSS